MKTTNSDLCYTQMFATANKEVFDSADYDVAEDMIYGMCDGVQEGDLVVLVVNYKGEAMGYVSESVAQGLPAYGGSKQKCFAMFDC